MLKDFSDECHRPYVACDGKSRRHKILLASCQYDKIEGFDMKTIKIKNWDDLPRNFTGIAEFSNGTKCWYLNDEFHREDGPAVEYSDGTKEWFLNGKYHREDGPAVEWHNGEKCWFLNGKYHRVDGPAYEHPDGTKQWYLNDLRHRVDGPAYEYPNGSKEYWIHNKQIEDEKAYWLLFNMMKLKGLA